MSAPDDKISSNRRRLFKALSTAPVVMTLKPGAALANSSGVQCAANEMAPATVKFYKSALDVVCSSKSGAGCHAFLDRPVWDPQITDERGPCAYWAHKFIVETSSGVYYVIQNPDPFGSGESLGLLELAATGGQNVAVRSGDAIAFYGNNPIQPCVTVDQPQTGLFLAIGGPIMAHDVPVSWEAEGVWPELDDTRYNVLGGSCLTSFPSHTGFSLADG